MKRLITILLLISGILLFSTFKAEKCFAQIGMGKSAPQFTLKDHHGKKHKLSDRKNQPLVILYFFDVASQSNREGLLGLDRFVKNHQNAELVVYAITCSSKEAIAAFVGENAPKFPVLLDDSGTCDQYGARVVLPTIYILGPKLKVLEHIRGGGGKSSETLMIKLAERELQRNHPSIAKAMTAEVVQKDPQNVEAKAMHGYAVLKEGRLDEAETTFMRLAQDRGSGEIPGKEGLAAVYLKKGQVQKAMQLAKEIEERAPERGMANVIQGNILLAKNQTMEAQKEYIKAADKSQTTSTYKSSAYGKLGRIQSSLGNFEKARDFYDRSINIDPYDIVSTSNKGITYEREGRWDQALSCYRQALSMDSPDSITAVLSKNAEEKLALQKDKAKKARIDNLVKELVQRFKKDRDTKPVKSDPWISSPMVLTFLDFTEKGGLAERDGLPAVMITQLGYLLKSSRRVKVVDRAIIEQLLWELNLGSSELANPETALKLGNVLSAKLIGTGTFFHTLTGTLVSLKLIDTETSEVTKVITRQLKDQASFIPETHALCREILTDIILNYPLRGYVIHRSDDLWMINLGSNHGVVPGAAFEVLKKQPPVEFGNQVLYPDPKPFARAEVVKVESTLSYVKILDQRQSPEKGNLVREIINASSKVDG